MTGSWNDFNDAQNTSIMPKGEIVKVRLTIRPGGHDDPSQGWTGGYATRGDSGAVYLNAEFTVLEGPYARRKIFTLIGLYSPKGPEWANMGRALIRGILNSARGISDKDTSAQAQAARRISGFHETSTASSSSPASTSARTSTAIRRTRSARRSRPDHRDYARHMGGAVHTAPAASAPAAAPVAGPAQPKSGIRPPGRSDRP